jgi:hypothetical protein
MKNMVILKIIKRIDSSVLSKVQGPRLKNET